MMKAILKQLIRQHVLLLLCLMAAEVSAQQARSISGTVKSAAGEALPGVSILVKGTTIGTTTDSDGKYTLQLPDGGNTLIMSFIGYTTREVPVGNQTVLNVSLESDVKALSEVVVLGFGTQTKAEQTAAISTIKAEDIVKAPVGDVTNAITGRMVGVITRQPQGRPGNSAAQIYIRGRASANSQALIIVDGVERETFGDIDPNDIESISTLKDAASTALFGLKGANGVIVVTTKRGKPGRTAIAYSGSVGVQNFSQVPQPLGSYESAMLQSEAEDNMAAIGQLTHPKFFTPEDIEAFRRGDDPLLYPNVNWMDEMIRKSWLRTQHNLSFRGGTKKASFFISLGYMFEDGLYKNFDTPAGYRTTPSANRTNFRSNLDFNLTRTTTLSLNLAGRVENEYTPRQINGQLNPADGFATGSEGLFRTIYTTPSWAMPFFPEYTDRSTPEMRELDDLYNQISGVGFGGLIRSNPYAGLKRGGYTAQERNVLESTILLNQKLDFITKGLNLVGTFAYDHISNTIRLQNGSAARYLVDRDTREIVPAFPNPDVYQIEDGLNARGGNTEGKLKTNLQLRLEYSRQFGPHKVSAATVATREYDALAGGAAPRTFQGLVYRSAYNFKDKYYAEFNGAYQGSENYPQNERYGFFPTVGLGYTLSEENFMRGLRQRGLDYLKIRGSYGMVGFGSPGRFIYLDGYGPATGHFSNFYFGNPSAFPRNNYDPRQPLPTPASGVPFTQTYAHTQIGNPNVTWEKSLKRNLGIEANFFSNRIQITADVFDETRSDILLTRVNSTPVTYGEPLPNYNYGKNYNAGIELELRLANRSGAFDYGLTFQFSHIKNKRLIADDPVNETLPNLRLTGTAINQFRGYATDGFYQSQEEVDAGPKYAGFPFMPGDIRLVDINRDGAIDYLDFTNIGYSDIPQDQYSLEPYIAFKGLRFSFLLQAVDKVSSEFNPNDNTVQWFPHQLDRWTPDNRDARYPAVRTPTSGRNIFYSSGNGGLNAFNLQDASFIKLRNVELSYQLPAVFTSRLGVSSANIGVTGQSLYTWTRFLGLDPENNDDRDVGYYVIRGVTYPNVRTFQFNLRLTL